MDYMKESLKMHELWRGKIEMVSRVPLATRTDLSLAYTPGVAQACLEIRDEPEKSFALTRRFNTVAVVTDGSAVLGLGDIGALAGMPVMEGKCVLFKEFGGVDAIPLCVSSKDVDEIVSAVSLFAGSFGGINLEDISAPRCFEIEKKLKEKLDIPVFHDDQHGTAIVVLAACLNALKVVDKSLSDCRIAVCGAGAAGTAIAKLMLSAGAGDVIMCDKAGIINREQHGGDVRFGEIARLTNRENRKGTLADAVKGADIFGRCFRTEYSFAGYGPLNEGRRDCYGNGKPRARNYARRGKSRGRARRRHGKKRFSQSNQQCAGFSRSVQGSSCRQGARNKRGNEGGCGARHSRTCRGRLVGGIYPARRA